MRHTARALNDASHCLRLKRGNHSAQRPRPHGAHCSRRTAQLGNVVVVNNEAGPLVAAYRTTNCTRRTAHDPLLTTHCSRRTAHDALLTTHCSRRTAHDPLLTTHCSRRTAHDALLTTHCSRRTTNCSRRTAHDSRASRRTAHDALLTIRAPHDPLLTTWSSRRAPHDTLVGSSLHAPCVSRGTVVPIEREP